MSSSPSPYAVYFDVPEHADVLLQVYIDNHADSSQGPAAKRARTESQGGDVHASAPPSRSYHCHAVILAVQSEFLKAQLSAAWQHTSGSSSTLTPGSSRTVATVDVHVKAEELDALQQLLRMMYSQALPAAAAATATTPLLLQCLGLADRFMATHCMELLVCGLAATPTEAIDCSMLDYVFRASPGVCGSRSYPALLESCGKALVRLFGDAPAVMKDEALLQQFCSLPHAAVLAWVKSDDLQVHSENCVVLLLSAWVKANQGSTAAQHEELAHDVRVFHLGPVYLHHILPNLAWFKGCSNMEYMPAVVSCIRAGIKMRQGLEAEKVKISSSASFALPPSWCAKPRGSSTSPRACTWDLSPSQLKVVNGGQFLVLLSPVSINGFLMRLQVQRVLTPPSTPVPGVTLGVYLGVDTDAMEQRGLPLPPRLLIQLGALRVKVGSAGRELREDAARSSALVREAATIWGHRNFLLSSSPSFLELVDPYLDAGQLHIEAIFSTVDC